MDKSFTFSNFTDALIEDVLESPTREANRWSKHVDGTYSVVPEDTRLFMQEKAEYYKDKPWAYEGKDYSDQLSTQIEINSKSDEVTIVAMLNDENSTLRQGILSLVAEAFKNGMYCPSRYGKPVMQLSHYALNGQDQDKLTHKAGTFDIVRTDKNYSAFYSIQVKTSAVNAMPKSVHKAQLVLLHLLNSNAVAVFIATAPWEEREREAETYVQLGIVQNVHGWRNIKVTANWQIIPW